MKTNAKLLTGAMLMVAITHTFAQPVIVTPPRNQTNAAGTTATFSVVATGAPPLVYQWRSHAGLNEFTNIPNATNATLVFTNVQLTPRRFSVSITNSEGSTNSALVQLFVLFPPLITTPPQSVEVETGAPVILSVSASGSAPLVYQWRLNGADLAGGINSSLTITNVQPANAGTYTVLVTNAVGAVTSQMARLSVHLPIPLLSMTNRWRYHQAGTDPGTAWQGLAYDDASWPEGEALFFNESALLPAPKRTPLALTNDLGQPIQTYYFRTHFNFTGSKDGLMLVATNYVDDGAVFYLNGVEIGRLRIPNGPVAASTRAIISLERQADVMLLSAAPLVEGDNVLAVEVHQESVVNADVVFGLSLKATTLAPLLPDLVLPAPPKPHIELQTFAANHCEVMEGCGIIGTRRLLRFDLEVRNAGTGDLLLGDPFLGHPHFVLDNCHGHYHYENLVGLRLLDSNGVVVSTSRKIGFALSDVERWDTTNAPINPNPAPNIIGITRGWSDIYSYNVPCQYVDITDTPPGSYTLEFELDPDNKVAELNRSNNITRIAVEIPADWAPCDMPPPNDDFTNAQVVPLGVTTVVGSNECATLQAGEPVIMDQYGKPARHSVWFRWTAPHSGGATIDTEGSNFPTFMGLYRGTALNSLVRVAFDADFRGLGRASRIMSSVTAGETYSIVVAGFFDNRAFVSRTSSGDVVLNIHLNTNDLFAAAQVITGTAGTITGTTVGTAKEAGEPDHAGNAGGRSIWYSWTAPVSGQIVFDTFGSTFNYPIFVANNTFDTLLAVYTGGNVSSLAHVASNDDVNPALLSRVSFNAVAGTPYHIAVDGRTGASQAGFCQLNWRPRLHLASTSLSGETIKFILLSEPGDDCVVESSEDLQTWTGLQSVFNSTGAQALQDKPGTTRFYRARLQ